MERAIRGFHLDDEGDWVAELSCGHSQHVRHRPPFQIREWVLEEDARADRIGTSLSCPLCLRGEAPDNLRFVRSSPEWTEETAPPALLHAHRMDPDTWGLLRVLHGSLRFVLLTEPGLDVAVGPGSEQGIPPVVLHYVVPLGPVRFTIDFLAVDRSNPPTTPERGDNRERHPPKSGTPDEGGETACWSGLVCVNCGAVLDGSPHRPDCRGASDG